jgi:HAE1 family hydrophobic/amphiphilic exporter-1
MERWTKWSLQNGIAVAILCLLVIGAGLWSAQRMKMETFPDVSLPAVFVTAVYAGASTQQIESDVTIPLEKTLLAVEDYESIISTSRENAATFFLRYPFGYDMDGVQQAIEQAIIDAKLPDAVETTVVPTNPNNQPVYEVGISAPSRTEAALDTLLNEQVIPELKDIDGVSEVYVEGATQPIVRMRVKANTGIPIALLVQGIRDAQYGVPLGTITEGGTGVPVRLVGAVDSRAALESLTVTAAGQRVRLSDVAVFSTEDVAPIVTRINGKPGRMLRITKETDANTVEVGEAIQRAIEDASVAHNLVYTTFVDNAQEVSKSVRALLAEGGYGILFTILTIFVFLRNVRATLIAIVSLPLSILATLIVLDVTGNTLNIMTLGGLAVSIGRIVDDSIVVIENMYRWRQLPENKNKSRAWVSFAATKEVLGPIASSTVATVVVFLPLAFLSGILGQFFAPFALTVGVSIVTSLIVAMTVIPVLGTSLLRNIAHVEREGWFVRSYRSIVVWSVQHKALVFSTGVGLLIGALALIPLLGVTFLPSGGKVLVLASAALPRQATDEEAMRVGEVFETLMRSDAAVRHSIVSVDKEAHAVRASIELHKNEDVDDFGARFKTNATPRIVAVNGQATLRVTNQLQNGPPTNDRIDIKLYSDNAESLREAARSVQQTLERNPSLRNVQNSVQDVIPRQDIVLRESARARGVEPISVMGVVGDRLREQKVMDITWDGVRRTVYAQSDAPLDSVGALGAVPIRTSSGVIPLRDVAFVTQQTAPVTIERENGRTNVVVSADIAVRAGEDTVDVSNAVKEEVLGLALPKDVERTIGGGFEDIFTGFESLGIAMGVAVGLVFVVLTATFGGVLAPFVVLTTLAFVPIGAFVALLVTGQQLSMSAMIGLLMLIGIVVTNAVVLLQRIEENRKTGVQLHEAVVEAAVTRLRPIVMTAMATICALIPLALSTAASGLISKTLAITVIGGLLSSTLVTLVFVPVLYVAIGRWRRFVAPLEQ